MIRKWCIILLLVFILTEIANHVQSLEQSPNSVTCHTVSIGCSNCEFLVRRDQLGSVWVLNGRTRTLQTLNLTTFAQHMYDLTSGVYDGIFEGYSGTDFWVLDEATVIFLSQYKQSLFRLNLNDQSVQRIPLLSQAYTCTFFGDNRSFQLTGDNSSQRVVACSLRQHAGQPLNTINVVDIQTGAFQEIIAIRGRNGGYRPWLTTLIGDDGRVYLQPGGHLEINEIVPALASFSNDTVLSRQINRGSWNIIELPDIPLGILQSVDANSNLYFRAFLSNTITKVSPEGTVVWQIPSSTLDELGKVVAVQNDGRLLSLDAQNGDLSICTVADTDPTPTPMPTVIAPPLGGDPVCPGGGGEWVWINGVPVFVCGTLLE